MLQTAHASAMPVLTLGMLVAHAQGEEPTTLDLIITGSIGDGRMNPASHGPDIWQVAATGRYIYVTDRAVLADLRAGLRASTTPGRSHIRVEGREFTDMAGNISLLVSRILPTPFTADAGELNDTTLDALVMEAPETLVDALVVVAHQVACDAGYEPEIDVAARTLSFANPDVRVTVRAEGEDRVSLTAARVRDGALLSWAEAMSLGQIEIEMILLTQRHRAA